MAANVQQTSSKLPADVQQFTSILNTFASCTSAMHDTTRKRICALLEKKKKKKFAGRLLDRVNTL